MRRREFLQISSGMITVAALNPYGFAKALNPYGSAKGSEHIDAAWYNRSRRFANLPMSRVAYVEHGKGPAALFLHAYSFNGYQWRGALERLHMHRRCIAPDVMSMGYTQTPAKQAISPETQAEMLAALLDSLHTDSVGLIGNDSGGLLAQIFLAKYPKRVRTLLLTNCDVDENSPPSQFAPLVTLAEKGVVADKILLPMLNDKNSARSAKSGLPFTYPERLSDETIEMYYRPLVETPLRKAQIDQFTISLGKPGQLIPIREDLRHWKGPARMVWGLKDELFGVEWAEWLDKTLPGSRGIRRLEQANLLFPEEMPDVIAEEAKGLWGVA